ncbi:hypothetical protein BJX64DRAFT_295498 [Aspergillus heterothallicus]
MPILRTLVITLFALLPLAPLATSAPIPSEYRTLTSSSSSSTMAMPTPTPTQTSTPVEAHTRTARQLPVPLGDLKLLNAVVPGNGIPESVERLSGDLGGRKHL